MNLTVSETAGKRSKARRGLLALVAQRPRVAGQALTVARDVMARPGAVHALRTRLAAAMPVEPRRAGCGRHSAAGEQRERTALEGRRAMYSMSYEKGHDKSDQGRTENQDRKNESRRDGRRRPTVGDKAEKVFILIPPISSASTE